MNLPFFALLQLLLMQIILHLMCNIFAIAYKFLVLVILRGQLSHLSQDEKQNKQEVFSIIEL